MLSVYCLAPSGLSLYGHEPAEALPDSAIWLDLEEPTLDEERRVEELTGLDIPTREEMREIEYSNRFYEEGGALFLTLTVVTKLDTELPENAQVTFILSGSRLITNRYVDPLPIRRFKQRTEKYPQANITAHAVFAGLLETVVERIADVLETVGVEVDAVSAAVFGHSTLRRRQRDFRSLLARVGQSGDRVAKARESLASLARLLAFVQQSAPAAMPAEVSGRLQTLSKDVVALSDHASFLSTNLNFVLDATLGMINIDQNNILKIFSVLTVVLLPPSVIAAMFGMNFDIIPAAHQAWGFWGAVSVMVASAVLPYLWISRKGWL